MFSTKCFIERNHLGKAELNKHFHSLLSSTEDLFFLQFLKTSLLGKVPYVPKKMSDGVIQRFA